MELNETLVNVLVLAAQTAVTATLLETTTTGSTEKNATTTASSTPSTTTASTTRTPDSSDGTIDSATTRPLHLNTALDADTVVHFMGHVYGKLLQPSIMNTFNVTLEYIESTVEPETAMAAAAAAASVEHSVGGGISGAGDDAHGGAFATIHSVGAIAGLLTKCIIMSFIILAAIFGNMLVIVSVMQHRRLR